MRTLPPGATEKYAKEFEVAESSGYTSMTAPFGEEHGTSTDIRTALELARYVVWLGANAEEIEPVRLGVLALACINRGMWWGEVASDLGLPIPGDWE